jgi:PA14 domain/Glycosyl hydrolase family 26/CARDB
MRIYEKRGLGAVTGSQRLRSVTVTTALTVAFVGLAVLQLAKPAQAASRPVGKLAPSSGAYWGMTTGYADGIAGREAQVGRKLSVHNTFAAWTDHIPGIAQIDDVANGRIPMITWQPVNTRLTDIAGGDYDASIIARARSMKAFRRPILLRFAHEMNGDWYAWSGSSNGGATSGPANYIAAWRHVHDLFVAQGATNVAWVWCVNQGDVPGADWNHWTNYYPGDSYVDWVGIDAYNWGTTNADNGGWRTMSSMLTASAYNDYAATKPIMVAETGSAESGGDKDQWIYDAGTTIKTDFPSVEAVLWFDQTGSSAEWPIDSSHHALTAYTSVGLDSYFGGPGLPDIAVTDVSWTPAEPVNGDRVVFSATYTNQGTAPTPAGVPIRVAFDVNATQVSRYDAVSAVALAPGQSRTVTANAGPDGSPIWPAISNDYTVRASVDDGNRVRESSESNNDLVESISATSQPAGLLGHYFDGTALAGPAIDRTDANIDFDWGEAGPVPGIGVDSFSVRWTGLVTAPYTGAYTFAAKTDDGERIWVDNHLLIDHWGDHSATLDTAPAPVRLTAGQQYPVKVEYREDTNSASAQLLWSGPNIPQQVVPASVISH